MSLMGESESRFQQMIEASPLAKLLVDGEGRIVLLNRQAEQLFGYEREALLGQSIEVLIPARFRFAHPDLRRRYLGASLARRMALGVDVHALRRDGTEVPVEIGLAPIDSAEAAYILVSVVDVSERKYAEERFQQVVEGAPSAMVMVDASGRIVLVNRETERVFGYARNQLIGRPVETLVPERFRAQHPAHRFDFLCAPAIRPMGAGRDLFALRSDAVEVPVEIGLNPIETSEGRFVLASIVDITERKRAQAQIEAALAEKTVLLNEIHHRVKNNLQIVAGLLTLQSGQVRDPQVKALLDESRSRVQAMALIHQFLYESGDFSRIDLGEYLGRLVVMLRETFASDRSRVKLAVATEKVLADISLAIPCGLLVNELVANAFKHAFVGGREGEVRLTLRAPSAAQPEVALMVADDGVGLPVDLDLASVRSLGLKLARQLADQMNARLQIVRAAAGGTCFELRFLPTKEGSA